MRAQNRAYCQYYLRDHIPITVQANDDTVEGVPRDYAIGRLSTKGGRGTGLIVAAAAVVVCIRYHKTKIILGRFRSTRVELIYLP